VSELFAAIAAVIEQHPDLSQEGWRFAPGGEQGREQMLTADFERQVMDTIVDVGSRAPRGLTPYALKHRVEARCGRYVSTGAAIVAMLVLGYQPRADRLGFHRPRQIEPHPAYRGPHAHCWAGR